MIATRRIRYVPGACGDVLETAAQNAFIFTRSLTNTCRSGRIRHHVAQPTLLSCSEHADPPCDSSTLASLSRLQHQQRRALSQIPRGADLLGPDALAAGENPDGLRKIVLDSYMPTGFDVMGMLDHAQEFDDDNDESLKKSPTLHMNGSMIAFPTSCFLWDVAGPKDVSLDSLSLVLLREPSVEFLFIGCNHPLPPRELNKIRREMKERGIVVEQLDLVRT
jgi:hypothetical protein